MEGKDGELQEVESSSSDSFIVSSDDDDESNSGQGEELHQEQPMSDEDIEKLISEFLEVESKAAEAQETLEKESLTTVEREVKEELAQTLHGDELEVAVAAEMTTFREEWEAALDELETESSLLLEQLDGAGIELPSLYKMIESQAPNGCSTEAWRKRTHWVGSQVACEVAESIADAEKYLQTQRPVRRRHGKLLEEGASGFLQKKIADDGNKDSIVGQSDIDWNSLNKVFSDNAPVDVVSFGTQHWSSVYMASTPQQAAAMGLKFPGVDEVEEIDEVDVSSTDPFMADAIANEKEIFLSEEQRKKIRKVNEEDDINAERKLQRRMKRKRLQKSLDRATEKDNEIADEIQNSVTDMEKKCETCTVDNVTQMKNDTPSMVPESDLPDSADPRESMHINESGDPTFRKRNRTMVEEETSCVSKENICGGVDSCPTQTPRNEFHCTACDKVAIEAHCHPLLKVIICKECKGLLENKMQTEDAECSQNYCGWCGRSTQLFGCNSCETLFCGTCIKRNISESCLKEVQSSGWRCCCCSPTLLQKLSLDLEMAIGKEDATDSSSDSDSENSDSDTNIAVSSRRKRKKRIRRILDDAELGEETKRKIAIEKERQERLKSLQSSARSYMTTTTYTGKIPEGAGSEVLGDASGGYIVNVVRESGEEPVRIFPSISAKLKAHQITGIRFMWENIVQSIRKVRSGDKGLGCILAHTMGLGKTFQVIAFLYTAMRASDLGLKTALIVTPVNVLHNWRSEFMKWKPSEVKPLRIFMLEDVPRDRRVELLAKWRNKGGIFLIGYAAFRNLSLGNYVKDRNMAKEMCCALQDGPDILVCDEAHIIKNTRAGTTQALKQVKCQRRIALTGSPLQNNLMEYYCMVDFVREGFLGSSHEFRNRFQNPIENGQHTNSTSEDVKIMNLRSHILYEQLKGFVQRMDTSVVKKDLPPKVVFVIAVKLSSLQRKMYKRFLDVHGFTNDKVSNEKMRMSFFAGYQALAQIWNHPGILQLRKDNKSCGSREDTADILADEISSDENIDYNTVMGEKQRSTNDILHGKNENGFYQKDWWNDLLRQNSYKEPSYSGKMVLLLDILTMSADVGDKALVFSQSIPTLDLIELYLSKLPRRGKQGRFWKKGKDWYRLDGRTESSERQKLVERFNEPTNHRVKCTLISTRAGSLGINLYAANRVIIVDGSWNPTYDLQAIYRAWRYGQKKPVFAYRLMAHGTMEEKIYKRQVTKEGLAARVVDRQQVHRTISKEEMLHLFDFGDDENADTLAELYQENGRGEDTSPQVENLQKQKVPFPNGSCSSDKLMDSLLGKHNPRWVANFHEHETLLQENEEEKLSKEEQDTAWELYQRSMNWEEVQRVPLHETATTEPKPAVSKIIPPADVPSYPPCPRGVRPSQCVQRKCTNLTHLLTLRSQGTKAGCSTICGECAQEISWENLNNGKSAR